MKVRLQKRMNRSNYEKVFHYDCKKIRWRKKTEILHANFERQVLVLSRDLRGNYDFYEVFGLSDDKKGLLFLYLTNDFVRQEAYLPIRTITSWYYAVENPYEY